MSPPVIAIRGLVKDYGRFRALDGLDLEVAAGEVHGFIGPNGAGKSTAIRVVMDLLRPTAGSVTVFGEPPAVGGPRQRARIGYLPGELNLTGRISAGEYLGHLAALRADGAPRGGRLRELAERFTLDLSRPLRALSKGNRQKVGLVQAWMYQPDLLILDEPTSGLDPLLQREFLALIRETAARGATILMSSHLLHEVESVAQRVSIIRQGRTVAVDSVQGLRERAGQRIELRFAAPPDPASHAAFAGLPGVDEVTWEGEGEGEGKTLRCLLHGEPDGLLKAAAAHHVVGWSARHRDLEELFLDSYRGGLPERGGDAR